MPFSRSSLGINAGRASAAAVSIISEMQRGLQKQLRQPCLQQRCALQAGAAGLPVATVKQATTTA